MEPQTHTLEFRRFSKTPKPMQQFSPSLYYLWLTDGDKLEYSDEALEVDKRIKWEHTKDEEMKSLIIN